MSEPRSQCGPGRPRTYDRDAALAAALEVFWRLGYEAATLDDLTGAMGLSRSSFYGCFGSKRGALLAAFDAYARRALAEMRAAAEAAGGGAAGARAILRRLADPAGDPRGCFLGNCLTELSRSDPEVGAAGRAHVERIEALVASQLAPAFGAGAADAARAVVALGLGGAALRKGGVAPARLEAMLAAAEPLLTAPG